MRYYEISPLISEKLAVFPGDVKFSRKISLDFAQGDHLALSSIETTLHLGAHADATNHYARKGTGIEQKDLLHYYGECQLIHLAINKGGAISLEHLKTQPIQCPRVLFCTNSFPDPNNWNADFCWFDPSVVDYLAQQKVFLLGIDTPSIDAVDSKTLPAHQCVYKNKMSILEGLVLQHVPPGKYHLVALPLRIQHADASPVRAVLFAP